MPPTESLEDLEESVNINEAFEMSVAVGAHSFAKMEGDIDKKRKQKMQGRIMVQSDFAEQQKRCVHCTTWQNVSFSWIALC